MSGKRLNSFMINEMHTSFKLTEERHRNTSLKQATTNNKRNKEVHHPNKLNPSFVTKLESTEEIRVQKKLERIIAVEKNRANSLSQIKLMKVDGVKKQKLVGESCKGKNKSTKNMAFKSKVNRLKKIFDKFGHKSGNSLEKRFSIPTKKDSSANDSNLFNRPDSNFQHSKSDSKQSVEDFEESCNNFTPNGKEKKCYAFCDGSDYTKDSKYLVDIHEGLFCTPHILKLKNNQIDVSLHTPSVNWSGETQSPKEKDYWVQNAFLSTFNSKITKISVCEEGYEITNLKEQDQGDAIVETFDKVVKDPIYYQFMNQTAQDHFSELCVFENSLKSNHVLGVVKCDLEFYGTLVITLLCGQISINGFKALKHQPLTIYSPRGISWVSIQLLKSKQSTKENNIDLAELKCYFSSFQLDNIMKNFNSKNDAIVLLQRNSKAKNLLSIFNRNMTQNIFPPIHSTNRPLYESEFLLNCLIQRASKATILQVPTVWTKLKLNEKSRLIVAGGKNVGKSTLVRFLVNRTLSQFSRILLIDLDIGQPEIFIPQTVSCSLVDIPLLGPGFFLNKEPDRAYVVGDVNLVMCADEYIEAVKQLLEYVHNNPDYTQIPWLVNTMGYNKGFGLELIAFLIQTIEPTDVVEICGHMNINNFDFPLEWKLLKNIKPILYMNKNWHTADIKKYALHRLSTVVPNRDREIWTMSSTDMRYTNLLSRISKCIKGSSKCISDCQPFRASLQDLEILHPNCKKANCEELIAGMEANVVYLAKSTTTGLPECLGLAIVRAIDYDQNLVYLLPSMSPFRLSEVNCIILPGELTLPTGIFKEQGPCVANDVPFVFQLDDSKSSKAIQQIYCRSPAFFKQPAKRKN